MSAARRPLRSPRLLHRMTPPRALGALLVIVTIVGVCWALLVPPWQSPDELSHYAYVESVATGGGIPGNSKRLPNSSDEAQAAASVGASLGAFYPAAVPPSWDRAELRQYLRAHTRGIRGRSNGGGPTNASPNPPVFYLWAATGYLIGGHVTAYARLYAMRLQGTLLLIMTTLGAWLLAGEVLGRRRLAQLSTAAVAGLLPMSSFMSTNVNPDALTITLWTFALWLGARVINHRARAVDVVAMCLVVAAAILTKASSYALVPAEALAVLAGILRRPRAQRLDAGAVAVAGGLVALLPLLVWYAISSHSHRSSINTVSTAGHPFSLRQFLSYLWQFYLPRLWFMKPLRLVPGLPLYDLWITQGAGDFGWLSVGVPAWMVTAATALLGALTLSSVWLLARLRDRRLLCLLAFLLLSLGSLLVLLHITEYRAALGNGMHFLQARYILPAVSLLGLTVGLLVARVPPAVRGGVAAVCVIGLIGAQAISLATVVHAYYM